MAGIGRREVEILVHATAPSRGQDDAGYRALAQSYLDFEPIKICGLADEAAEISEEDVDYNANSQLQEELAHSTLEERESEASYQPDDVPEPESVPLSHISQQNMDLMKELSQGIVSPVLSFDSAVDNADSPALRGLVQLPTTFEGIQQQLSQHSWKQYATEIADSQPEENEVIPAFSSPTRILQLYLQQIQSSAERSSSSYDIERDDHQSAPSTDLPSGIQLSQSQQSQRQAGDPSSTSGLPSSPSPQKNKQMHWPRATRLPNSDPPSTQDPATALKSKWPESSFDDNQISSSAPMRLAIESSTVTTRITKSRKRQRTDGSINKITKIREVTSSKVTMVTTSSAPSIDASDLWAETLEIHPPPPKPSTKGLIPIMLVTPSLKQVVRRMPLEVLFQPKHQSRDLRPMERGYWLVRCGTWDPVVRKRCWEFLGNFVGKGLGGWGIWCTRDELDTIKMYCWGTVVGHSYVLLYVASETKIKGTGACWIDGDREAIVTMPS